MVDTQLASAQATVLSAEHQRSVAAFGETAADRRDDLSDGTRGD